MEEWVEKIDKSPITSPTGAERARKTEAGREESGTKAAEGAVSARKQDARQDRNAERGVDRLRVWQWFSRREQHGRARPGVGPHSAS